MAATLTYNYAGSSYSRTMDVSAVRSIDEPDQLERVAIVHNYLDGTIKEQILGMRRLVEVQVRATSTADDRRFLALFILATDKQIFYNGFTVVVANREDLVSKWLYDCEHNREFTLELIETVIHTQFPPLPTPSASENVYLSPEIEIIGISDSPETFTTNSGKLALQATGAIYPVFDDTLYKYRVVILPAKKSQATFTTVALHTVSGGNITFQAFYSDAYTPNPNDQKIYCTIDILQETI